MTQPGLHVVFALVLGLSLGGLYFGGLWLTVKHLPKTQRPRLHLLWSLALRMAFVLLGFYLLASGPWLRLIAALLGFLLSRTVLTRLLGREELPRGTQS